MEAKEYHDELYRRLIEWKGSSFSGTRTEHEIAFNLGVELGKQAMAKEIIEWVNQSVFDNPEGYIVDDSPTILNHTKWTAQCKVWLGTSATLSVKEK